MLDESGETERNGAGDGSDAPISLTENETGATLVLQGSMDVRSAAELHGMAVEASRGERNIFLVLRNVSRLDASAVQILAALAAELSRQGRELHLVDPPAALATALSLAGIRAGA